MSFFFNNFPGFGGDDDDDGFSGFPGGFGKPKPKKDVDTTKYYKVLGVDKNCSQDDIKRAYKKLVRTKHPDKGGNEKEFQEIQVAYNTLSDEDKRKVYDEYGEEGIKEGMDGKGPSDIFDFFTGGRGGRNAKRKTKSVLQQMEVSLEDILSRISEARACASSKRLSK